MEPKGTMFESAQGHLLWMNKKSVKDLDKELNIYCKFGPLWWSSGQRTHLLLQRPKFEFRRRQLFLLLNCLLTKQWHFRAVLFGHLFPLVTLGNIKIGTYLTVFSLHRSHPGHAKRHGPLHDRLQRTLRPGLLRQAGQVPQQDRRTETSCRSRRAVERLHGLRPTRGRPATTRRW